MTTQLQSQNILYPPVPPTFDEDGTLTTESSQQTIATINTIESETFITGKFDYVESTHTKEMLANAWQAINLTETWDFVRMPIESFMLSRDDKIWVITAKMKELGYYGHSGFSFGWTMRQMQFIAQHGEKKFREEYLKN